MHSMPKIFLNTLISRKLIKLMIVWELSRSATTVKTYILYHLFYTFYTTTFRNPPSLASSFPCNQKIDNPLEKFLGVSIFMNLQDIKGIEDNNCYRSYNSFPLVVQV